MTFRIVAQIVWIAVFLFDSSLAFSENSVQPYIDQIKEENAEGSPNSEHFHDSGSYTEQLRRELQSEDSEPAHSGSYIDSLLASDPEKGKEKESEGYSEKLKRELEPAEEGGAIQAFHEGRSELKARKKGAIHHAVGVKYGDGGLLNRNISAPGFERRGFNDVYGSSYSPDVTLFYEYQPFHSEIFGNIGIVGMGSVGVFSGLGAFTLALSKPGGGSFPLTSNTKFRFFAVPVTLAVDYRFNLFRIFRPFILAGPTFIGYSETRDDGFGGNSGYSKAILASVGVSVLLDWVSRGSSWDLYSEAGIKHYYLTVDYTQIKCLASDVDLSTSGFRAGLTFEL